MCSFSCSSSDGFLVNCPACRGETTLAVFQGDIRDADFVRKVCRGASVVFHMASIIDVYNSMEYGEMYGINVKGKESPSIKGWIILAVQAWCSMV